MKWRFEVVLAEIEKEKCSLLCEEEGNYKLIFWLGRFFGQPLRTCFEGMFATAIHTQAIFLSSRAFVQLKVTVLIQLTDD